MGIPSTQYHLNGSSCTWLFGCKLRICFDNIILTKIKILHSKCSMQGCHVFQIRKAVPPPSLILLPTLSVYIILL